MRATIIPFVFLLAFAPAVQGVQGVDRAQAAAIAAQARALEMQQSLQRYQVAAQVAALQAQTVQQSGLLGAELAARAEALRQRALQASDLSHAELAATMDQLSGVLSGAQLDVEVARLSALSAARLSQMPWADASYPFRMSRPASSPRAPWAPQDTADATYRQARQALNQSEYREAARLFASIYRQHPRSAYAAEAAYFEAFSLSRLGGREELAAARARLEALKRNYPDAQRIKDADALAASIDGRLARLGDTRAAEDVVNAAAAAASSGRPVGRNQQCPGDNDDVRLAALNALVQLDDAAALPVLKQVLQRRDACSAPLRRKAVFLLSQTDSPDNADVILDVARNDPDPDVQRQAVFWLSQVDSDKAVDALESILRSSGNDEIKGRALFALSQHKGPRANEILRQAAGNADLSTDLRARAIFGLSQTAEGANDDFLRKLFARETDPKLRERIMFSLAQHETQENSAWLVGVATNPRENIDVRRSALFQANQAHAISGDALKRIYDTVGEKEMKMQVLFVLSQQKGPEAADMLMGIARNERDPELRKKAIFWLSQVDDPRVAKFLLEIINN